MGYGPTTHSPDASISRCSMLNNQSITISRSKRPRDIYWLILYTSTDFPQHINLHSTYSSWPWMKRGHYISWRLIMFFLNVKAGMSEIDLQHNRRVNREALWGLFEVMCSQRQRLIFFLFSQFALTRYLCQSSKLAASSCCSISVP